MYTVSKGDFNNSILELPRSHKIREIRRSGICAQLQHPLERVVYSSSSSSSSSSNNNTILTTNSSRQVAMESCILHYILLTLPTLLLLHRCVHTCQTLSTATALVPCHRPMEGHVDRATLLRESKHQKKLRVLCVLMSTN
jgi:hypothetical protein